MAITSIAVVVLYIEGVMPRRRLHYAWVIAAVTFVVLLVTAGIRAVPGVLMVLNG